MSQGKEIRSKIKSVQNTQKITLDADGIDFQDA